MSGEGGLQRRSSSALARRQAKLAERMLASLSRGSRVNPIVLEGHEGSVISANWSPDGKQIVTGSGDGTARIWRADGQGEPIVLEGHEDWVRSANWSPDGKQIVTASDDATARIWTLEA